MASDNRWMRNSYHQRAQVTKGTSKSSSPTFELDGFNGDSYSLVDVNRQISKPHRINGISESINTSLDNNNNYLNDNPQVNDGFSDKGRSKVNMIRSESQLIINRTTRLTALHENTNETNMPIARSIRSDYRKDQKLTAELKFYFKNPMDKWRTTRAFPWKLFLQLVKLIVVTIHISSIGFETSSFITKETAMEATLRSLVFEDWNPNQELNSYPPGRGPYAVYTKAAFFSNLDFAIKSMATLTDEGINQFAYDSVHRDQVSSIILSIRSLALARLNPFQFHYDINPAEIHRDIPIDIKLPAGDIGWDSFSIEAYLAERNETIDFDSLNEIQLITHLRTIFFHSLISYYYSPTCYKVRVTISYDNRAHSGQILLTLDTKCFLQPCQGSFYSSSIFTLSNTYTLITWIVFIISSLSLFLCCRSLRSTWILWFGVSQAAEDCQTQLTITEHLVFVDIGLLIILLNDFIFILVSAIKLTDSVKLNEDVDMANRVSLLYGIGILLTWCNLLRYLNLFERFNVVTRTVKKAAADLFKFTLVAGIIFTGYCLSGWIVLGPHHLKFNTISNTVECLFSLINADDMFATFSSFRIGENSNGPLIWWFSRIYIYSFVSLFIYFILNLFITIIIEARESVQNPRFDPKEETPFLKKLLDD